MLSFNTKLNHSTSRMQGFNDFIFVIASEYESTVFGELLNRYSVGGKIDSGILATFSEVKTNELVQNLKKKNFSEVRKWCVNNLDNDPTVLLRHIYDNLFTTLVPASIPAAVLVIAKYQYQVAFVADQEINMLACLTEIMVECEFK